MNFSEITTIITVGILASLLGLSLLQFSSVKKSMRIQSEQQLYARIIESRMKLENTEAFTKMAKENPLFAERLALVDNPDEYYTVVAYIDLIEFLFHQYNTKMMDTKFWPRWEALAKTLIGIPKFKKVWDKTKHVHNLDFIQFMDSL
jgi:type II secretory pathway pseudopilin PulG